MNSLSVALFVIASATVGFAADQPAKPATNLLDLLTKEEWRLSGLDRLSSSQRSIIDAALSRNAKLVVDSAVAAREGRPVDSSLLVNPPSSPTPTASPGTVHRSGLGATFGLEEYLGDWRDLPVLTASVIKWVGGNSFELDNGQVWTSEEKIPYELPGKAITIAPRPFGNFALVVDGRNTTILVTRVK